jgi:Uma2 family endonuclease
MSVSHEPKQTTTTKLTYDHLILFPNDGNRHEIIDGRHFMNPSPVPYHQSVSGRIHVQLFAALDEPGLGTVLTAPVDVQFTEFDVVVPDLIVVLTENRIITTSKIKGAPDLVIEILSPSTKKNDEELKRRLYEQHRVPEYWIVDPKEHVLRQFVLNEGHACDEAVRCHDAVTFHGTEEGVTVDLTRVW